MHIQVVTFRLKGISVDQFNAMCDELAPAFASIPGMISKVWIANVDTGVFGGVYTWHDRAAMEAFAQSGLFAAVLAHPNLNGVASQDFGVMEGPTRVTHGLVAAPA